MAEIEQLQKQVFLLENRVKALEIMIMGISGVSIPDASLGGCGVVKAALGKEEEKKTLDFLRSNPNGASAVVIAKHVTGNPNAGRSAINPFLYLLQQKGLVVASANTPPIWKAVLPMAETVTFSNFLPTHPTQQKVVPPQHKVVPPQQKVVEPSATTSDKEDQDDQEDQEGGFIWASRKIQEMTQRQAMAEQTAKIIPIQAKGQNQDAQTKKTEKKKIIVPPASSSSKLISTHETKFDHQSKILKNELTRISLVLQEQQGKLTEKQLESVSSWLMMFNFKIQETLTRSTHWDHDVTQLKFYLKAIEYLIMHPSAWPNWTQKEKVKNYFKSVIQWMIPDAALDSTLAFFT